MSATCGGGVARALRVRPADANARLREGARRLDAAVRSAGRSDPRGVRIAAATPEEIRSGGGGWEIRFGFAPTPVGECLVAQAPRGVCFAAFVTREAGGRPGALAALGREWPAARRVRDDRVAAAIADAMFRASPRRRGPLRLLVRASAFELRVWETLAAVPEGSLVSYGDLARAIGRARAARAVASAVARNPVAVAIPCHRVVRATGMTGGYRWGVPRKVSLLAREAARPRAGAPAPDQSSN